MTTRTAGIQEDISVFDHADPLEGAVSLLDAFGGGGFDHVIFEKLKAGIKVNGERTGLFGPSYVFLDVPFDQPSGK